MFSDLILNINFWSAIFGLVGTILIFLYGIPPQLDKNGAIYLVCEQNDKKEKDDFKITKIKSYFGLAFIAISYILQIFNLL